MTPPSSPPPASSVAFDILGAVENLLDAGSSYLTVSILPWTTKDPAGDLKLYADAMLVDLRTISRGMAYYFGKDAAVAEQSIRSIVANIFAPLANDASGYWNDLLGSIFAQYDAQLKAHATIDPDQVADTATAALDEAAALGLGSRIVSAAFELVLPKSLNTLNWIGPILANFSGFDEIVKQWREPRIHAAIGRLSELSANKEFRTEAPDHADAESMYSRRLISRDQLIKLVQWSGLMTEFEEPMLDLAYRPISPRLLARAAEIGAIPQSDLIDVLNFAGYRDVDINRLVTAFAALALAPYQATAMQAAKRSFERGITTAEEFDADLDYLDIPAAAKPIIMLNSAIWKEEQLVDLYRKSISEAYKTNQITDAQYVPALEAIGIGAADANAHYAVDSVALRGRVLAQSIRAEERAALARTRAEVQAAVAGFKSGAIDEAALSATLIATGLDPEIAASIVIVQTERRRGNVVFIYGKTRARADAQLLQQKVRALEAQFKKQLIDDAAATAALQGFDIPDADARALLAQWAALKTKPTTTGELLPR